MDSNTLLLKRISRELKEIKDVMIQLGLRSRG